MTIKNVQLTRTGDVVELSASCKIRKIGWDRVYFSVGAAYESYVYSDASAFAALLLIPSMLQGEDLIIQGSISKQLYIGMQEIMKIVLRWDIGLKPIAIRTDKLAADPQHPTRTASFFSGGVDSFYTYLKHKDDTPSDRVDSLILIKSFDVDPRNAKLWQSIMGHMNDIADREKVDIVTVETNIHELLKPMLVFTGADYCDFWDYTHGGCLAGVGLFLRKGFRRIYIPSTHSVGEQIPWGSNYELDGNWSTKKTTFIHDGSEATRVNKVKWQIAKSPVALDHLRVCYQNEYGTYNCGHCDKCLRTMINLYIAGALEHSATFPHEVDTELVAASPTIEGEYGGIFHGENLQALRDMHLNEPLQKALETSMSKSVEAKPSPVFKLQSHVIYYDRAYFGGALYSLLAIFFGRRFE